MRAVFIIDLALRVLEMVEQAEFGAEGRMGDISISTSSSSNSKISDCETCQGFIWQTGEQMAQGRTKAKLDRRVFLEYR